jgi:hypothetical protein
LFATRIYTLNAPRIYGPKAPRIYTPDTLEAPTSGRYGDTNTALTAVLKLTKPLCLVLNLYADYYGDTNTALTAVLELTKPLCEQLTKPLCLLTNTAVLELTKLLCLLLNKPSCILTKPRLSWNDRNRPAPLKNAKRVYRINWINSTVERS